MPVERGSLNVSKKKGKISRYILHSPDIKTKVCPKYKDDVFCVTEKNPCKGCRQCKNWSWGKQDE